MKKLILIIALALVSTGAWGEYFALGAGMNGCGAYLAEKQKGSTLYLTQVVWVQGFITGGNAERASSEGNSFIGKGVDIELWLESYCRLNPLHKLTQAAQALVVYLKPRE